MWGGLKIWGSIVLLCLMSPVRISGWEELGCSVGMNKLRTLVGILQGTFCRMLRLERLVRLFESRSVVMLLLLS